LRPMEWKTRRFICTGNAKEDMDDLTAETAYIGSLNHDEL